MMHATSRAPHTHAPGKKPAAILICDGDKGGVGKSFLARILAYLLSSNDLKWVGIDLDARNGHLVRFHGEQQATPFDWTDPVEWNRAYDRILEVHTSSFVLIDLPAQAGTVLPREFPRLVATATSIARPVIRFWSVASEFDSVNLLSQTLEMIDAADTFAVLNLRNAIREDFDLWLKSNTRRRLLEGGGSELSVPKLASGVASAIEVADLSFANALPQLQQPYFRFDIEGYLAAIQREFAPLMERLA